MEFAGEDKLIKNGKTPELQQRRKDLLNLLKMAIGAVDPYHVVSTYFRDSIIQIESSTYNLSDFHHIYLASFGKASIGMTEAIIDHCEITKGVVITNDETKQINHDHITVFHGGHPLPNQGGIDGAKAIESMIHQLTDDDLLIILISGGGSALLCHPRISLEDMQKTTALLLKSGAEITEINTARKHLSHVKGGQLIQMVNGTIISFIISDVINDPLGFIASGPTVGDDTSFQDVKNIFDKYHIWKTIPHSVKKIINKGLNHEINETPTTDDLKDKKVKNVIVANNTLACETLLKNARSMGYRPMLFSTSLHGEAKDMGTHLVKILNKQNQIDGIDMIIAGGETTVTVHGKGKGGRNQEMVLGSLSSLQDHDMLLACCGSDGIDGMSTAAGAIADPMSKKRAEILNLSIESYLDENNSFEFFKQLDDLLITGPTGKNVMDLYILLKGNHK